MSSIEFDSDLHALFMREAHGLAQILSDGDPSSLPESVFNILNLHAEAIKTVDSNMFLQGVAERVVPPFDREKAVELGGVLMDLLAFSDHKAKQLEDADQRIADLFRF